MNTPGQESLSNFFFGKEDGYLGNKEQPCVIGVGEAKFHLYPSWVFHWGYLIRRQINKRKMNSLLVGRTYIMQEKSQGNVTQSHA